jgi:hypothetical protein
VYYFALNLLHSPFFPLVLKTFHCCAEPLGQVNHLVSTFSGKINDAHRDIEEEGVANFGDLWQDFLSGADVQNPSMSSSTAVATKQAQKLAKNWLDNMVRDEDSPLCCVRAWTGSLGALFRLLSGHAVYQMTRQNEELKGNTILAAPDVSEEVLERGIRTSIAFLNCNFVAAYSNTPSMANAKEGDKPSSSASLASLGKTKLSRGKSEIVANIGTSEMVRRISFKFSCIEESMVYYRTEAYLC